MLIVHPSLPVHSVAELVKFLKANPGFNYASGGVGSQHHVNAELFRSMAGLDITNVSYRGGGPAVQDVVAGHVKMMFADVGGAAHELIRDGRLRALAVTTARRVDTMPDIPTMHEAGITGYEANAWIAIVAPARRRRRSLRGSMARSTTSCPSGRPRRISRGSAGSRCTPAGRARRPHQELRSCAGAR